MKNTKSGPYKIAPYLLFPVALILPITALIKVSASIPFVYLIAYFILISAVTLYVYWADKRKAQLNLWRIPEITLHSAELVGGWTAAFFAQRIFRHKISKKEYQFTFWFIAVIHQYLAFDTLHQWKYAAQMYHFIKPFFE